MKDIRVVPGVMWMLTERDPHRAGLNGAGGVLKFTVQCSLTWQNQRPRKALIYLMQREGYSKAFLMLS